jgi:hypothetical protein
VKPRGRPARSAAQVRAVVEFMETPRATKAAAAKKFYTIERNIEIILKDPRAKSWAATRPTVRQVILELERCQAAGIAKFTELARWRNPKLDFIENVLGPEEIGLRDNQQLDDVYELALGRQISRRREARRARKVNENK